MTTAVILRDPQLKVVAFTPDIDEAIEAALVRAAEISNEPIGDADHNTKVFTAAQQLKELLKTIEAAREEAKRPLLEYGRALDAACKAKTAELNAELNRISQLLVNFQMLESARQRAAKAALRESQTQLERERQEAIAAATSHEEIEKVNEEFAVKAAMQAQEQQPTAPTKAKGQRVTEQWDFRVTDIYKLAEEHPGLVKMTPKRAEILAVLNMGRDLAGIEKFPVVKVAVGQAKAIEV